MVKYSAKMLTAGRVHLLEEALYSFLNLENSEESELIIVNDYPYQKLIFEHPIVKIVNNEELFPSIGEKDIFAHNLCQGEIILVFDDDDIALPNHLTNIERYLEDNDLLHWANGVFYNESKDGTYRDSPSLELGWLGNSGIVYTHSAYNEIGKSPIMNEGYDRVLVEKLTNLRHKVVHAKPDNKDASWFYRWSTPTSNGVGNYHLSGLGDYVEGRDDVRIRNFNYLEGLRKQGKLPIGDIHLNPHWKRNYQLLLNKQL